MGHKRACCGKFKFRRASGPHNQINEIQPGQWQLGAIGKRVDARRKRVDAELTVLGRRPACIAVGLAEPKTGERASERERETVCIAHTEPELNYKLPHLFYSDQRRPDGQLKVQREHLSLRRLCSTEPARSCGKTSDIKIESQGSISLQARSGEDRSSDLAGTQAACEIQIKAATWPPEHAWESLRQFIAA